MTKEKEDDMKFTSAALLGSMLLASGADAQARLAPEAISSVSPAVSRNTQDVLIGQLWERNDLLSKRDRSLVTIAGLTAAGKAEELPPYIELALDNGLTPAEIGEIYNQLAYYSGWPNALAAVDATRPVFEARGVGPIEERIAEKITLDPDAEAARKKTVAETTEPFAPGLAEFTNSALFGDLWLRPDLAPRDRSLATVAALIAMGQAEQLNFHLNYAMDNGLTEAEAGETVSHLAFYAGFPRAYSAVPMLKQIFDAREN